MGRGPRPPRFTTRVRARRLAAGLTQKQLAGRVGMTRQALNRVEGGDFLPNTATALRLAEVLGVRVEQLFELAAPPGDDELVLPQGTGSAGDRVVLARVGERLVGYPATSTRGVPSAFQEADALLHPGRPPELLVPARQLERTALLLGCDPALNLLRAHLERRGEGLHLHCVPASSQEALAAAAQGLVHVAGTHLVTARGRPDLGPARRALATQGGRVVSFATWEQGLVLAPGNPLAIRRLADLARPSVRLLNRGPGTGSRILLDALLAREGIPPEALHGYQRQAASHTEVCQAVALGAADAGLGVASLAAAAGLDFLPLGEVRFDLVIPEAARHHPAVAALLEVLREARFLQDLGALPSYGIAATGGEAAAVAARRPGGPPGRRPVRRTSHRKEPAGVPPAGPGE